MQVVRYKHGKTNFEVACKVGTVLKYRKGQLAFENVLSSEEIWKDIKKGDRPSADELKTTFNTDDVKAIAKMIVDKGDVQLTDNERKEILEKKRNEIINYIHKYYIEPKTKTMIPITRIDSALTEIKVRIDPDQPTEKQIQEIIKKLPGVLTIKRAEISGVVSTTHQYLAQVSGVLKKYNVTIQGENYTSAGCEYSVAMVPGDYDKIISDLNTTTKGDYDFKIDGQAAVAIASEKEAPSGGKGRGRGGRSGDADSGGGRGRGGRKK